MFANPWAVMLDAFGKNGFVPYYLLSFVLHPRTIVPALIIGILTRNAVRAIVYSVAFSACIFSLEALVTVARFVGSPVQPLMLTGLENDAVATILDTAIWTLIVYVVTSRVRKKRQQTIALPT
jgi:hypothetical protein